MTVQSHIASAPDGVPIHYDVQGTGAVALVFVHGWCCNRGHWAGQVDHFAPDYTLVCIDLAGHGASGRDRARQTMSAFGQDVVAVVEQLGLEQVVLIGHSRKRFIGEITNQPDSDSRLGGTIGACLAAYHRGATIFRVHDVEPVVSALSVAAAIGGEPLR